MHHQQLYSDAPATLLHSTSHFNDLTEWKFQRVWRQRRHRPSCKLETGSGWDETQFTPHFETGQNCKKNLNMFSFEIFSRQQSWLVANSVHTADKTRRYAHNHMYARPAHQTVTATVRAHLSQNLALPHGTYAKPSRVLWYEQVYSCSSNCRTTVHSLNTVFTYWSIRFRKHLWFSFTVRQILVLQIPLHQFLIRQITVLQRPPLQCCPSISSLQYPARFFGGPSTDMTYNVFSRTLNLTQLTTYIFQCCKFQSPKIRQQSLH